MHTREQFQTADAPTPTAALSQAVAIGPIVAVSGQVGFDPVTREPVGEGVAEQTQRAIDNVRACLAAAGLALGNVVRVGVFLARREDFAAMNEVYGAAFDEPFPARTTVVAGLSPGVLVEIDAIAVRP